MAAPRPRRPVGLLGRKPGVSDFGSHFQLGDYLVSPFPPDDGSPVDFSSGVTQWGMLGNDVYGDCGPAGDTHVNMANAWEAHEQPPGNVADPAVWPTAAQVVQAYLEFTGGQDTGVDLGQWLGWRMTHPIGPLPPIAGFAQVPDSGPVFEGAVRTFGALYDGVLISRQAMAEAQSGRPFTSTATDWVGGHCFPIVGRSTQWGEGITWGALQLFSWEWWQTCREESYVIFTQAQADAPGGLFGNVAVAQLRLDILALR